MDVLNGGWLPPELRTPSQKRLTEEFHEECGFFSSVNTGNRSPERVLYPEIQLKVTGKLSPKVWQTTGSCVGAGGANAYIDAMLGDKVFRQDSEEIKPIFPWPTYGKGREIAGMRKKGEGSFGAAQAKACTPEHFGYLPLEHSDIFEKPTTRGFWLKWPGEVELNWSHPSGWPVKESELKQDADDFGIVTVTRIKNSEECEAAIDQGYGVTLASMFGTRPRLEKGVLLGRWNSSWAHQMSCSGKWRHPDLSLIFWIQNQWGDAHGEDPTMAEFGVHGGFWVLAKDFDRICREGEVYAHSNTNGFPSREFDWSDLATYED